MSQNTLKKGTERSMAERAIVVQKLPTVSSFVVKADAHQIDQDVCKILWFQSIHGLLSASRRWFPTKNRLFEFMEF